MKIINTSNNKKICSMLLLFTENEAKQFCSKLSKMLTDSDSELVFKTSIGTERFCKELKIKLIE